MWKNNFYKLIGDGEKEKVASDVDSLRITDSGEILYQNFDDELFLDKTKLSTDVDEFSFVSNIIAHATLDDKLYFMA